MSKYVKIFIALTVLVLVGYYFIYPNTDKYSLENEGVEVEAVTLSNDYYDGLTTVSENIVSIKTDSQEEQTIKLLTEAGRDSNGQIMFDDGQKWSLLVIDGDKVFPLIDKKYIQLGDIEYWSFVSYEDNKFHILVMENQGAGIVLMDYTYNDAGGNFVGKKVYDMENINRN